MVFGHQKNLKIFSRILAEEKFPHAVLFTGPNKIGKRKIALEIAKYLERNHKENFFDFSQKKCSCHICQLIDEEKFPEIFEIKEDEKDFSIKKIREIKEKTSLSSVYKYKIVIINNAEKLSLEATGALLKMLEEPHKNTIFFLLTPFPSLIIKTIISRLVVFNFDLLKKKEIGFFLESLCSNLRSTEKEKILDISLGRPGVAKEMLFDKKMFLYYISLLEVIEKMANLSIIKKFSLAEKMEKNNKSIEDFLFMAKFWFRDILLAKTKNDFFSFSFKKEEIKRVADNFSVAEIQNIIKNIQKIQNYIFFSNASRLLAIENLFLSI